MYVGPLGAFGLVNGSVASQAWKATSNWGRNRRSATTMPFWSPDR